MPKSFEEKYDGKQELGTLFFNRFNDLKEEIKVQLPCRVVSVNHTANQVDLEILDYNHNEKGELVNYPIIPNVPIRQPMYSGSAYIVLPVRVGDVGTIEFFDSSVDDLITTSNYEFDYTEEWHSINNGLFTNGFLPKNKLFTVDSNAKVIIGSHSGKFIFKVTSNDELEIIAPSISITAPNGVSVKSPDFSVSGDVTVGNGASGTVACQGSVLTVTNGIITGIV